MFMACLDAGSNSIISPELGSFPSPVVLAIGWLSHENSNKA